MNQKGFTLVEALVSISIIIILTGVTLANYSGIRTQAQVDADLEIVVGALRNAQAEALSPERGHFDGISSDRLCSIGVVFDSGNNQIQPSYRSVNPNIGDCDDPNLSREYGDGITPEFTTISESNTTIYFDAPFGGLSTASTSGNPVEIVLRSNQNTSLTRNVRVYPSGIIETQ